MLSYYEWEKIHNYDYWTLLIRNGMKKIGKLANARCVRKMRFNRRSPICCGEFFVLIIKW